jgi:hypothetical protein
MIQEHFDKPPVVNAIDHSRYVASTRRDDAKDEAFFPKDGPKPRTMLPLIRCMRKIPVNVIRPRVYIIVVNSPLDSCKQGLGVFGLYDDSH